MTKKEKQFMENFEKLKSDVVMVCEDGKINFIDNPTPFVSEFPFVDFTHIDETLLFFVRNGYKAWIETKSDGTHVIGKKLMIEVVPHKVEEA